MSRARVLADFVGGTTTISGTPTFTGTVTGAGKDWTKTSAQSIVGVASSTITGLPSTIEEIIIFGNGVQRGTTSGNGMVIRLGDSGGLESSGYVQPPVYNSGGTYYINAAAEQTGLEVGYYDSVNNFVARCWNISGNKWKMESHAFTHTGTKYWTTSMCEKELSATLDRVAVSDANGTNFAAGTFQFWYK